MFDCHMCLEDTKLKDRKWFQLSGTGIKYAICPFCYRVISTLRNHKKNFEVSIQQFE